MKSLSVYQNEMAQRSLGIFFLIIFAILFLIGRLFWIQVLEHEKYKQQAFQQHWIHKEIPAKRGDILDRNGIILATSIPTYSCYCDPKMIKDVHGAAKKLSPVLEMEEDKLVPFLTHPKRRFVWLKRFLDKETSQKIQSFKIAGVQTIKETKRVYPHGKLASHVLGFTGNEENGLEGVEANFQAELSGENGFQWELKDGRLAKPKIYDPYSPMKKPVNGADIYLTIDHIMQSIVEKELQDAVSRYEAKGACAVLLDAKTAQILALASLPDFDPNDFRSFPRSTWKNKAIADAYELGSVMKPLVVASALSEKLVSMDTTIFCHHGSCKIIPGRTLRDTHGYGDLTVAEILIKSSNIGTTKIGMQMGAKTLCHYLELLNFGKKTGVELPGESPGILKPAHKWTNFTLTSVPMGHEICATPLQMAASYLPIAGDGIYRPPSIVEKVVYPDSKTLHRYQSPDIKKIYSGQTIKEMQQVLRLVVEKGTAQKANIKKVEIAGKTGTAQKLDSTGGYSHEHYISVFVGFAPYKNPTLCALVMVDEPKGAYYGGTVSAPPVANILKQCIFYEKSLIKKYNP
ncbi:MAG: penicillin-binding protein 2 [Candidatus Brocadiae bacterium]|nr:penicillin-binding protein 2 [Candidatus Brocadiia bacterium]